NRRWTKALLTSLATRFHSARAAQFVAWMQRSYRVPNDPAKRHESGFEDAASQPRGICDGSLASEEEEALRGTGSGRVGHLAGYDPEGRRKGPSRRWQEQKPKQNPLVNSACGTPSEAARAPQSSLCSDLEFAYQAG